MISESTPERLLVAFAAKTTIKSNSQVKAAKNDGTKTGKSIETPEKKKVKITKIKNREIWTYLI